MDTNLFSALNDIDNNDQEDINNKNANPPIKSIYKSPHNEWNCIKKKNKKFNKNKPNIKNSNKEMYDENSNSEEIGNNKELNNKWNVWVHENSTNDWTLDSYDNIYTIDTIGKFWRYFNNFHLLDKINNQYFIMRDFITPIWEDINNREGGICSIKIDYYTKINRNEIGSEIMITLCTLIMNETFIQNSTCINGISYSIKNKSIYIKLWISNLYKDNIIDKLPINLLNIFDNIIKKEDYTRKYINNRVSIRFNKIIPEFSD